MPGFARKLGDAGFLAVVAGKIARLLVFAGVIDELKSRSTISIAFLRKMRYSWA